MFISGCKFLVHLWRNFKLLSAYLSMITMITLTALLCLIRSVCMNALGRSTTATSLLSMASITALQNIDSIWDVGEEVSCLEVYVVCLLPPPTILPFILLSS